MASPKQRRLYTKQISFHPYKDNWKEIQSEESKTNAGQAEVIRILVDEALRARRLKQLGSDTTARPFQQLAKEALADELKPLKNSLVEISHTINSFRDELSVGSKSTSGSAGTLQGHTFELQLIILLLMSTLSKVITNINLTWTFLGMPALSDGQGSEGEDPTAELERFLTEGQSEAKSIEQTFRNHLTRAIPETIPQRNENTAEQSANSGLPS